MRAVELFPWTTRQLVQNRVVVLRYPDGPPELFNAKKSMAGYERIERALAAAPGRPAKEIMGECSRRNEDWKGEEPLRQPVKTSSPTKVLRSFFTFP